MSKAFHPLHSVWRRLPVEQRRRGFAALTAALAPKVTLPPPISNGAMIVGGELNRDSGLGEGARIMLRALEAFSVPVTPLRAGLLEGTDRAHSRGGHSGQAPRPALILHVNSPHLPAVLLRLGRRFLRGRRIVGYWAWELPTLPPLWSAGAGCVHEVWAPSAFSARAIEPLAPGRVRVVPHALAAAPILPAYLDRAAFGLPEDAVVVLVSFSLASSFERKNPLAAIRAFRAAFGDRRDRILVLKISHAEHYATDMRMLREATGGAQNIRFEERLLPIADSYALTRCVDIVLSLHRSEGFGLVPAEAMLLGRTVIATDWSATAEFIDTDCGLPVAFRLVPARDPRGVFEAPGAQWAEADLHSAVSALRRAADDAALRTRLGMNAEIAARERFSGAALLDVTRRLAAPPGHAP
ncbi:glycosyltransferase [Acetobacter nitrogenifigens]|uniref:glycosyltransferase n=1 Tax=Acetobacter nitrogenifigens TaxID=285268 RepID=UPI00041495B5|nr:glycosyltransferase [Acetobacter nitrogenifigens]